MVIPCYNEEAVLHETAKRLKEKILVMVSEGMISTKSRIMFVNDGLKDNTWNIIQQLYEQDSVFSGVSLSRNRGHQNALLAGLMTAKEYADMVISLDADFQDDINAIDQFVEKYYEGYDIVYGVRNKRETDAFFKCNTALTFYKFQVFMGVDAIYNHADYRLMSKRVLEGLEGFREENLFLRGIVPLIGYKYTTVAYDRNERFAGESKFLIFLGSILVIIYSFIRKAFGFTVGGWAFLSCSIWLLGGIELLGLGAVGEYIGKIYNETKQRPRYIISDVLNTQ